MTLLDHSVLHSDVGAVVASLTWWHGVVAGAVASLLAVLGRHLAERSRRRTITRVLDHARPGTVVRQDRGPGGPALTVEVEDGTRDDEEAA